MWSSFCAAGFPTPEYDSVRIELSILTPSPVRFSRLLSVVPCISIAPSPLSAGRFFDCSELIAAAELCLSLCAAENTSCLLTVFVSPCCELSPIF